MGFKYHKEVVCLMSGEFRQKMGDKYINFAWKWVNYVLSVRVVKGQDAGNDRSGRPLHEPRGVGDIPF